jgi:His-Xaa-Ser system protein HxsD
MGNVSEGIHQDDAPEGTLTFDESIYSRDVVLRASYWFADRCYVSISHAEPGKLSVTIKAKNSGTDLDALLGEFQNTLLDCQLRVEISRETAQIRELIVAKAFAEGDLLDDAPKGDWRDPIGARK